MGADMPADTGTAFRILGPLDVMVHGQRIVVGQRRARLILGVLLLSLGQSVSIERLTRLCWFDEEPPHTARNGIQVAVSRLRTALGDASQLTILGDAYQLDVDPALVDAHQFLTLTRDARKLPSTAAVAALRQAERLWRGPVLADTVNDQVREALCRGLIEERLSAIEERIDHELALGLHQHMTKELTDLVGIYPTRERMIGALTLALYRDGRTHQALETLQQARRLLADEVGVDPGPVLADLELAILRHSPSLQLSTTPIRIPPNHVTPAQLPLTARAFTGRTDEIDRLDAFVATAAAEPKAVPIVVVSGMPGVGKTALALQWAHRVAGAYPDGQLYLDLRGHSADAQVTPAEALTTMLRALGGVAEQIPSDPAEASGLYRTLLAGRAMLIVLDNARSVEQVRPLLPGTGGCLVVVTSRYRLADLEIHDGAHTTSIDVLQQTEAEDLVGRLIGSKRSAVETHAIADIARLCAYLPLALRIAAARLAEHPDRAITLYRDQLAGDDRLGILAVHGDEEIAVRAAFDLSYRLILPADQRLFRLLGLIPGNDFSDSAVAALTQLSLPAARQGLARLAAAHLIQARNDGRYDLHDLIREYARDLGTTDAERRAAHGRLYGWYLNGVSAAAQRLYSHVARLPAMPVDPTIPKVSFADAIETIRWLDAEFDALTAAIRGGIAIGQAQAVTRLADGLRGFLLRRKVHSTWMTIADAAMEAALRIDDIPAQAAVELSRSVAYGVRGDYPTVISYLQQAQRLSLDGGWLMGELIALGNLGAVHLLTGALARGIDALRMVIKRATGPEHTAILANNLNNLGEGLRLTGHSAEALEVINVALPLYRSFDSHSAYGEALESIGMVYHDLGQYDLARDVLTRAAELYGQLGDDSSEAVVLADLARVTIDEGHPGEAGLLVTKAIEKASRYGSMRSEAAARNVAARMHLALEDFELAREQADEVLRLARTVGIRHHEIEALVYLAKAHRFLGDIAEARECAQLAWDLADTNDFRPLAEEAAAELQILQSKQPR